MFKRFVVLTVLIVSSSFGYLLAQDIEGTQSSQEDSSKAPVSAVESLMQAFEKHLEQGSEQSGKPETNQENHNKISSQDVEDLSKILMRGKGSDQQAGNTALLNLVRFLQGPILERQKMTEALSPEVRKNLEKVMALHTDFVAKMHAPHAIYLLGCEVLALLGDEVADEHESITHLRIILAEDLQLLPAGGWSSMFEALSRNHKSDVRDMLGDLFSGAVAGSSSGSVAPRRQGMLPMIIPTKGNKEPHPTRAPYSMEELIELEAAINNAENEFKKTHKECLAFDFFKRYVGALVEEDLHKLALVSFEYLEPAYLDLTKNIYELQKELLLLFDATTAGALAVSSEDSNKNPVEQAMDRIKAVIEDEQARVLYADNPYFYWLRELKQQEDSCVTYAYIKRRFNTDGISQQYFQIFRLFAHAYTYVHHMYNFYYSEAKKAGGIDSILDARYWMPMLLNYALTSSVAASYFFNVQNIARNSTYYDLLLNKGALSVGMAERAWISAVVADFVGVAIAGPTFFGKPLSGLKIRTRLAIKTGAFASSWAYYYIFYNGLFNRNAFFSPTNTPDAGESSLWPMEYRLFRKSFFSMLQEGVDYLSFILEMSCYNKFDPEVIADVDEATFGLINPSALHHVVRAFLPMALLSTVGSLLRGSNLTENQWEAVVAVNFGMMGPQYSPAARQGMSRAALYAENKLVRYTCSTFGYNMGYWLGDLFHDEILVGIDKTFRGLCKASTALGITMSDSEEMAERFYENASVLTQMTALQLIDLLKKMLWPTPETAAYTQTVEPLIKGYLVRNGYLDINHDVREYREAIVNAGLSWMAINKLTSFYNAAIYARAFKKAGRIDPKKAETLDQLEPNERARKEAFLIMLQQTEVLDQVVASLMKDMKRHLVSMGTGWVGSCVMSAAGNELHKRYGPITPKVKAIFN